MCGGRASARGAEGYGGGAGSSGCSGVLAGRLNAARECRPSSRSPPPCRRIHWHAARRRLLRQAAWTPLRSCADSRRLLRQAAWTPATGGACCASATGGACCAWRLGRRCEAALRTRKLDPCSRLLTAATGRARPMARGRGQRVKHHMTFMCCCGQKCSRLARRPRSCGCGRWSTSTTSSAPSTSASGSKSFP
jgi:hypothetical protein